MLRIIKLAITAIYLAGTMYLLKTMMFDIKEIAEDIRERVEDRYFIYTMMVMFVATCMWPFIVGQELYQQYKNQQNEG